MSKRVIAGPTPYEMSAERDKQATAMIEQADSDVSELRVNIRWRKVQIDVIKQAAERLGMPYQTYIRQAAFRQAISDLKETEAIARARRSRARRA